MGISLLKITLLSHFVFGPAEFGVFGVGILLLGILELLTETGINVFLVQETEPLEKYLNTAWVVSIMRGVLIAAVLALISYPISVFFNITSSWTFILAFSLVPLLRGFINPAITNLQKKLLFKEDAFFRFGISAIEDISIIILAFLSHNIFSFVYGIMIGVVIEVVLTFIIIKEKPKFEFINIHFREIVNRGKWVTLAQIFNYLFEHTDDVVVGRLLNVYSLGIYQNSYSLASLSENAISQQLSKVTFPIYVSFRDDKKRVKRAFYRSFWTTLAVTIPFGLALFFLSDPVVKLFLGSKWLPAIPVLRILALFSVTRALINLFYPVFLAFKKQNYVSIVTLASIIVLGILVVPMTRQFGVTGAAFSALIGSLAGIPIAMVLFNKLFSE